MVTLVISDDKYSHFRLSSQQSLLKPAEKPSVQMQHYMQTSSTSSQSRKLSDSTISPGRKLSDIIPVRKLSESTAGPATKLSSYSGSLVQPNKSARTEESAGEPAVEEVEEEQREETEDSESDSSEDSESATTELDEVESHKVELQVPEIKINLAETEELTGEEKCDIKCDKEDISEPELREEEEGEKRKKPERRPSLLKTVVNIKSDTPVTVVNYTETEPGLDTKDNTPSKQDIDHSDLDDSFKTPKLDDTKDAGESFTTAVDTSSSVADDSLVTEKENIDDQETSGGPLLVHCWPAGLLIRSSLRVKK